MAYSDPERQREYQRLWMARRRAQYLQDKCCVKCGSTDRLEIDHVEEGKKVSHRVWSWSALRREAELAKCQILCWPCHRQKTDEFSPDRIVPARPTRSSSVDAKSAESGREPGTRQTTPQAGSGDVRPEGGR